jgi:hypothetical protein
MGELSSGSNAAAMETLNGKISVLSDSWHNFEDTLLNDRSKGALKDIVDYMAKVLDDLSGYISKAEHTWREFFQFATRNTPKLQDAIGLGFKQEDLASAGDFGLLRGNTPASSGKGDQIDPIIEQTNKLAIATGGSTKAYKAHAAGMSEAQKAAKQLQDQFKSLSEQMEKEYALSLLDSKSKEIAALDYDLYNGSLRNLSQSQKDYLEGLRSSISENEKQKEAADAYKSNLDQLTDSYKKLTLSARDYFKSQLEANY